MNTDPLLIGVTMVALAIFCVGFVLRLFKQPHVVGYIVIGAALGYFGLVRNEGLIAQFGNLGIVLLLFFIGMHVSVPKLLGKWRVAILGTAGQIVLSVALFWAIGTVLQWPLNRVILFGFVISLSSTAVILKILHERKELDTKIGQNVLSILLVQDLAIIPMILVLDILGKGSVNVPDLILPFAGGAILIGIVAWVLRRKQLPLPFKRAREDHEMQVFLALVLCFGLSLLTGLFGLSTALGAFVAGFLVKATRQAAWVQDSLESLHVIFVALFFIYVGVLIDLRFVAENAVLLLVLVLVILLVNTALNGIILRLLGDTWGESLYAGGLLSQIGEFSFLLATIGFKGGIIVEFGYHLVVATIAITLLLSPLWIQLVRKIVHIDASHVFEKLGGQAARLRAPRRR